MLAAHERLGKGAWQRVLGLLDVGDPEGEVGAAYLAKELLREVYDTTDVEEARRRLRRFYAYCRGSDVPELERPGPHHRRWESQILAWHHRFHQRAHRGGKTLKRLKPLVPH